MHNVVAKHPFMICLKYYLSIVLWNSSNAYGNRRRMSNNPGQQTYIVSENG